MAVPLGYKLKILKQIKSKREQLGLQEALRKEAFKDPFMTTLMEWKDAKPVAKG